MARKKKEKTAKKGGPSGHLTLFRTLLAIGFTAAVTALFPERIAFEFTDLAAGDISEKEIIAPFNFPLLMTPDEIRAKREEARKSVTPIYAFNNEVTDAMHSRIIDFFASIDKLYDDNTRDKEADEILKGWAGIAQKSIELIRRDRKRRVRVRIFDKARENVLYALRTGYRDGIILDKYLLNEPADREIIVVRDSTTKIKTTLSELTGYNQAHKKILTTLRNIYPKDPQYVEAWFNIFSHLLQPNVEFDEKATAALQDEASAGVPISRGLIYKGEKILDEHKRVTPEDVNVLRSLAVFKHENEMHKNVWGLVRPYVGRVLAVILLIAIFAIYLYAYRPRIWGSIRFLLMTAIIFLIIAGTGAALTYAGLSRYLIPVTLGSMLLTILFDEDTAFVGTVLLCLLTGTMQWFDFRFALVSFMAGFTAILCVMKVRHRSEFYRSSLLVPLAYVVSISMIGLLSFAPFKEIMGDSLFAIGNGFLSTIVTIGILPFFETVFKASTDITLLELSDLNRPLLKQLSITAPGTYHHSIIVGNLAEAGAERVGANSLLARVGSYYHDIGKMNNPIYFVENQLNMGGNKHDNLSPSMSSLVLSSHTKNGVELARKHKLPLAIRSIIEEHHGNSIMSYFYQRAVEAAEDGKVDDADFRYPGPRPQTREAAIVMLADSCEAASRSLKDPTTTRLRSMVNQIFESKFRDGQLDECDLTFKDLSLIRQSFMPVLSGIFHNRVEYPDQKQDSQKKQDASPPQSAADNGGRPAPQGQPA